MALASVTLGTGKADLAKLWLRTRVRMGMIKQGEKGPTGKMG